MQEPHYNAENNTVFLEGVYHRYNPDTDALWTDEAEALAYIDALPEPEEPEAPEPEPAVLPKIDFIQHCEAQLLTLDGVNDELEAVGVFGTIIRDARASSVTTVVGCMEHYGAAGKIRKSEAEKLFSVLLSNGLLTQEQNDVVLGNWPTI